MFRCMLCQEEKSEMDRHGSVTGVDTCRYCALDKYARRTEHVGRFKCPGACGMHHDTLEAADLCCEKINDKPLPQYAAPVEVPKGVGSPGGPMGKRDWKKAVQASKEASPWHKNSGPRDYSYFSKETQDKERDKDDD